MLLVVVNPCLQDFDSTMLDSLGHEVLSTKIVCILEHDCPMYIFDIYIGRQPKSWKIEQLRVYW